LVAWKGRAATSAKLQPTNAAGRIPQDGNLMRIPALALFVIIGLAVAAPASADVHITLQNGRVSIDAKDATLREILAEWAKVGQTKIVNGEVSVHDVTIKESTINDPALETCFIQEVMRATWKDDELPDWEQDDELVIRPERGMKKFWRDNIDYVGAEAPRD